MQKGRSGTVGHKLGTSDHSLPSPNAITPPSGYIGYCAWARRNSFNPLPPEQWLANQISKGKRKPSKR